MNRCKAIASILFLTASAALFAIPAAAQTETIPQTQNEAAAGGRTFPVNTLRGSFMVVNAPQIELDGNTEQLAPGARIISADRMLVMPAAITGQKLLVNYRRDSAGMVHDVWILTPDEANAKRASADKPLLNFWPFVANSGPHDDGKTPFNQLPKYGQ
jgi:hypothetical protein